MYKLDSTFTSHALYSIRQDRIKFPCSSIFTFYTLYCEFSKIIKVFTVLVSPKPIPTYRQIHLPFYLSVHFFLSVYFYPFSFICLSIYLYSFLHFFSVKVKSIRITLLIHCNMLLERYLQGVDCKSMIRSLAYIACPTTMNLCQTKMSLLYRHPRVFSNPVYYSIKVQHISKKQMCC